MTVFKIEPSCKCNEIIKINKLIKMYSRIWVIKVKTLILETPCFTLRKIEINMFQTYLIKVTRFFKLEMTLAQKKKYFLL